MRDYAQEIRDAVRHHGKKSDEAREAVARYRDFQADIAHEPAQHPSDFGTTSNWD